MHIPPGSPVWGRDATLGRSGLSPSTVRNWRAAGRLVPVQPRVDRVAGAPVTWEQHVLAAVLSAGRAAAASHRAAGRIWRIHPGDAPVEIVVPRGRSARLHHGVVVHHTTDDIPTVRRQAIPTTTPMRTTVDLGAVERHRAVEDALDRALADKLCTLPAVEWELARVARPGRRGAGVLHRVLDARALGDQRPDGLLEPGSPGWSGGTACPSPCSSIGSAPTGSTSASALPRGPPRRSRPRSSAWRTASPSTSPGAVR